MKKVCFFVCVLVCLLGCISSALAEDEISKMSYEELRTLQTQISQEMITRPEAQDQFGKLPKSLFTIGIWTVFRTGDNCYCLHIDDEEINVETEISKIIKQASEIELTYDEKAVQTALDIIDNFVK